MNKQRDKVLEEQVGKLVRPDFCGARIRNETAIGHTISSFKWEAFNLWMLHVIGWVTKSKTVGVITVGQDPLAFLFWYPLKHPCMATPSNPSFDPTIGLVDSSTSRDFQDLNGTATVIVPSTSGCDRDVPFTRTDGKTSNWLCMDEVVYQSEGKATIAFFQLDALLYGFETTFVQLKSATQSFDNAARS